MNRQKSIILSVFGIVVLIVLIIGIQTIVFYNRFIDKDETIEDNYATVFSNFEQRHNTITQIVATVNGLQQHELAIYNKIIEARTAYAAALANNDVKALAEADALEAVAVTELLFAIENNPNLVTADSFEGLMDTIYVLESMLKTARDDYNDAVKAYNKTSKRFPGLVYRSIFGFEKEKEYWKIDDGKTEIPDISFN